MLFTMPSISWNTYKYFLKAYKTSTLKTIKHGQEKLRKNSYTIYQNKPRQIKQKILNETQIWKHWGEYFRALGGKGGSVQITNRGNTERATDSLRTIQNSVHEKASRYVKALQHSTMAEGIWVKHFRKRTDSLNN